ncbi:alpha/beta fold hydrolase [Paenibacillus chondroitinus]|uniref:Alpha/beta fold hydrolase n=1 Tax=Paenibacillus chondroitinus TaxID=59842 RepID=A0ABU6DBZ4_9BACL|nr:MULTISPECIES: acetylxylan esterase [Paenibacillus]MCY9656446.1 acetylxylan esterase [Paenibacillus anseongense]MEB4795270.1 alpha/beta fold hydrolase [Paenibacillus chondroitinus]
MPVVDLSLEQLKTYEGRNPRPMDFDAYWDQALQEMQAVDPCVELIPAEFQVPSAECFHLYFTGVNGARIYAKYVRPKTAGGQHPAVLQFHGYSGCSGDWSEMLAYTALGCSTAWLDVRGQGGLSEDTGGVVGNTLRGHIIRGLQDHDPHKLFFRHVFLDTAQLAAIVMNFPEVDAGRVGVTGWSQGGALAIACAALEPRIRKVASVYPFLSDYKRVWEMDLARDAYWELQNFFRYFDPQHLREEEWFTKLGYIDIQHLAPRIQADALIGVGLRDTVCPPSSQFAAINKMKTSVKLEIYPDFSHEPIPGLKDQILQFMARL